VLFEKNLIRKRSCIKSQPEKAAAASTKNCTCLCFFGIIYYCIKRIGTRVRYNKDMRMDMRAVLAS